MYESYSGHNGFSNLRSRRRLEAAVVLAAYLLFAPLLWGQSGQGGGQREPRAEAESIATGPAVGEKIPFFRAPDQHGEMQDFDSIRGPKGAMIVFFRSADW